MTTMGVESNLPLISLLDAQQVVNVTQIQLGEEFGSVSELKAEDKRIESRRLSVN